MSRRAHRSLQRRPIQAALTALAVALAGMVFSASPAKAGDAETVHLGGVDSTMTVGYQDGITVDLRDSGSALDSGYSGTVVFSAAGTGCVDCLTVTPNDGAGNLLKYTFTPGDGGVKNFTLTWTVASADAVLTVTAPLVPSGTDTDTAGVAVSAQTATDVIFDPSGEGAVDTTPDIGTNDQVTVSLRNGLGDIDKGYTGTIDWDQSTCKSDFLVDNAASSTDYTFTPSDAGARTFNIKWTDEAQTPSGCKLEVTAALSPSGTDSASVSNIEPQIPAPPSTTTSTSTTSTSTTSTTVPNLPHIQGAIVTGSTAGGSSAVKIWKGSDRSAPQREFTPYPGFQGGVNVALGDVNDDGWADVITGAGPGGGGHVKVFSGKTGLAISSFFPYPAGFNGGVFVASGDVNNDGKDDVVVGTDGGGGPHVKVFSGAKVLEPGYSGDYAIDDPTKLASFFAYANDPANPQATFLYGVRVAAVDTDGDDKAEIVTGAGPTGGPHVAVFKVSNAQIGTRNLVREWMAYGTFAGGVFVGANEQGGTARIITGAGPGGGQHVIVWNPNANGGPGQPEILTQLNNDSVSAGARVAIGNGDADGSDEFVLGNASQSPVFNLFDIAVPPTAIGSATNAFPGFGTGVSVAIGDI